MRPRLRKMKITEVNEHTTTNMDETYSPCFFWGTGGASSSEDKTAAAVLTTPSPVPFPLISESNIASEDTSFTEILHKYRHWKWSILTVLTMVYCMWKYSTHRLWPTQVRNSDYIFLAYPSFPLNKNKIQFPKWCILSKSYMDEVQKLSIPNQKLFSAKHVEHYINTIKVSKLIKRYLPLKHELSFTGLSEVLSHKTKIFITTTVRTSNSTHQTCWKSIPSWQRRMPEKFLVSFLGWDETESTWYVGQ
jgi:hypothetical protein